jgi:PhnB protein
MPQRGIVYAVQLERHGVLMSKAIPLGWHSVTPRLVAKDPAKLVGFLKITFEASGDLATDAPSLMKIGDSMVMVSGTGARKAMPAFLYVYVDDVDATYRRALQAGAASLEEPKDLPYGDRRAMVKDPCGNDWQIATHKGEY